MYPNKRPRIYGENFELPPFFPPAPHLYGAPRVPAPRPFFPEPRFGRPYGRSFYEPEPYYERLPFEPEPPAQTYGYGYGGAPFNRYGGGVPHDPYGHFLHNVDIMRSERQKKANLENMSKKKTQRGGKRNKAAKQANLTNANTSVAKPSGGYQMKVCMNCGRSDHADLSIPEKCPHPPATDEFVLAQIKKHQEDSVGVDSLPEDDATVRELIKTELTGSDILSIQLKDVVPSNDPTECIWQMNKNLCKLCYHIGHLATDCSPEKKATPEFMHKMRLLIKLYKRKRILDAKDAGLTIVNGNIVELTKGFNKNKELEQVLGYNPREIKAEQARLRALGLEKDITKAFVNFKKPDGKTAATTSAPKRYEEEYTSVSQLPYVDINQLQPASRGVVTKVKLPVYAENTKVIGFATPKNNWQGVEPTAPIGYPGWITQPNVTINSNNYKKPVTVAPGVKTKRPSRLVKAARKNLNETGHFTVCMNCAQRGHSAMSCKNEKVDNMVVDKRIKEAAAELKAQQENEVRMMLQRELNGTDKLSMQLKILAPDGYAGPDALKLCKNCAKIGHKQDNCMQPKAPREEVKHIEMLLNLHRKHYAMNAGPNYTAYWL